VAAAPGEALKGGAHIFLPMTSYFTIPAHNPLKIGTLAAILSDIESHHKLTREKLLERLFS